MVLTYMDEDIISDAKDTYDTRKDSFQQYLDDIESSMVTQAGKDAYNQIAVSYTHLDVYKRQHFHSIRSVTVSELTVLSAALQAISTTGISAWI